MFLQNFPQECLDEVLGGPPAFPRCGPLVLMLATRNPSTPWRLGLQFIARWWPNSSCVSHLTLANVDVDSGMLLQLFLQDVGLVW